MTVRKYTSRSQQTTLTAAVTSGGSTINVANASTLFATVSAGDITGGATFTVVIDPDTALEEIVEVTGASSNTLTITRSVDAVGTATDHSAGAVVRHMIIGRDLREANAHIEATGTVHGLASTGGVVVGTAQVQTLTNKTLTTPVVAGATLSGTVTSTATITGGTLTGAIVTGLSAPSNGSDATTKTYVDSILGSATAASTSAASAATSATAAATSAASAATSATAAATSATSAAASQTAAATSATSAAASATAAATSATTATTQATNAATSATSAAASATAAATSATSAAASATTAAASVATIATYASNALTSANSAATSATAAATSASSASTSQTAAATSATSAAASATAAATSATSAGTSATAAATSATFAAASQTAAATSATSAAASASAAATSEANAAASYDSFDDRYLGAKSTAPSTDNDGNALLTGALYFNTAVNAMYVWTGSAWTVMATSGDISAVYAGTGLTGGGASGDVTVNLDTTSVYVVPSQSGQSGKYLTTNGSVASWGTVTSYSAPTLGTTSIASGATVSSVAALGLTNALLTSPREVVTVSATAATGTIQYDVATQSVLYYTTNASANWTMNFRASSGASLDSVLSTGQSATVTFLNTNGTTAYYPTAITVDGTSVTPKWQGGTAVSSGNASSIDAYVYTIIKTASATFTVLASQTKFA